MFGTDGDAIVPVTAPDAVRGRFVFYLQQRFLL
jgi:hypothetical protein